MMPNITSNALKDTILYDMVRSHELMGEKQEIYKILDENHELGQSLYCFTLFELKYNLFWDNLPHHLEKIDRIVRDPETKELSYFFELMFYVTEFLKELSMVI